ncbi:MAG: hypothetical protein ACXWT1_10135 [Methylobacter sp.]
MSVLRYWLITVLLTGCSDPITDLVNNKFPPVNIENQRQTSINTTAEALSLLQSPNIAVSILLSDAEKAINNDNLRKQGITDLKVSGDKQLVHIHAEFERKFTEDDAGDNEDTRKILKSLHPEISGSIDAFTGISGEVISDEATPSMLQLRLLPGLSNIKIKNVKLVEKVDSTKIGEVLANLLNKYRDNITGEFTRSPFSKMPVPVIADKPSDISQTLKLESPGSAFTVNVNASPVTIPVKLDGVACLVDKNQVTAILQLSPLTSKATQPSIKIEKNFDAINSQIMGFVNSSFRVENPTNVTWIAIRKELIATGINNAVSQAGACVNATGKSHQKEESKVPMPNGDGIDCSSDRNCESSRTCSFSPNKDERDCSTCIVSRPVICAPRVCAPSWAGGGCIGGDCTPGGCAQYGNDLFCETGKAAQNALYVTDAKAREFDCNRLRETEKLGCQAEEFGKKALCEAGKVTLNAIRRTGNFANIDVESDISFDNLNVCLQNFSLSPGLDHVAFNLDVKGQATADVDVKFVPLDIFGHLTCPFPWQDKRRFHTELRDSRLGVSSTVKIDSAQEKATVHFLIDEMTVKAKMSPSPTEFLLTSPGLTVSCTGLNFVKPLVVALTPFLPVLRGEIDQKINRQEASLNIPLPILEVGSFDLYVRVSETPSSLLLTGNLIESAKSNLPLYENEF